MSTFSGRLGDGTSRTYASVTQYSAAGLKERESYGTGTNGMTTPLYLKLHYNKRQQLVDLRLGSVNDEWNWNRGLQTFYYGTDAITNWNPFADDDDNNGNVRRALHYVPTAVDGSGDVTTYVIPQLHDYNYDALNRISSMLEWQLDGSGNWQSNVVTQNYGYDRFGNRGITSATGGVNNYNPSYTASTNRISSLTYDSAGNITYDAASGGTMAYDAENHMVMASSGGTYVYDGEGKRVKRTASSQEWWYVYGVGGELVAEYLSTATTTVKKEYGYRGGQLLVLWDADKSGDERLKWLVTDHLGSTRMEADKSGSLSAMVRHDYLPFGEELAAGIRGSGYGYLSTNVRQKFTGHERDGETGLDFAQARYCASIQGRFTSPDPMMASGRAGNPQSWNRYSYVLNRPLSLIDPNGMEEDDIQGAKKEEKKRKAVVVIFGGGPGSSDAPANESAQTVNAGGKVEGLGESDLANYEAQSIAQQIKNDFPDAEVILSGPNGINSITADLNQNRPENILIYGYSMGASSAVGTTNVLTNVGIKVDQLTTVDSPSLSGRLIVASPTIKHPEMVGDALNYIGTLGKTVHGAQNVPITPDMRERTSTPMVHRSMEDITAPRVIQRIEGRLSQIFNKPKKQ